MNNDELVQLAPLILAIAMAAASALAAVEIFKYVIG